MEILAYAIYYGNKNVHFTLLDLYEGEQCVQQCILIFLIFLDSIIL